MQSAGRTAQFISTASKILMALKKRTGPAMSIAGEPRRGKVGLVAVAGFGRRVRIAAEGRAGIIAAMSGGCSIRQSARIAGQPCSSPNIKGSQEPTVRKAARRFAKSGSSGLAPAMCSECLSEGTGARRLSAARRRSRTYSL